MTEKKSSDENLDRKIDSQRGHNTDGTLTGTKIRRTGRSDNPGAVGHTEVPNERSSDEDVGRVGGTMGAGLGGTPGSNGE